MTATKKNKTPLRHRPGLDVLFRHRIAVGMITLLIVFSWAGFQLGDRYGLLVGFFSAVLLIALVFFYVDWRLTKLFPFTTLEGTDPYGVLRTVREEAGRLSMRVPEVHILKLETPTALSAGLFNKNTKLFLTQGLLERLTRDEVALVIAYELQRVRMDQTQSTTAIAAVTSLIARVSNAFDALLMMPFTRRHRELRPFGPLTVLTTPLIGGLNRLAARRSEYLAIDEKISGQTKRSEAWAQTLWKLDAYNKTLPLDVNLAEASLFTVNPLARFQWCRFASAQPPIEERVRRLTGRFPL